MRFMSFVMLISVINLQITRSVYCGPVLYRTTQDGCHALLWPFTMLPILLIQLYIVCHPRTKNAQYGVHGSFSPVMPCKINGMPWNPRTNTARSWTRSCPSQTKVDRLSRLEMDLLERNENGGSTYSSAYLPIIPLVIYPWIGGGENTEDDGEYCTLRTE